MTESDKRETEPLVDELASNRGDGSKTSFAGIVLNVVQVAWLAARWSSQKVWDISLWLILSFTEDQRAVLPMMRVTFSQ